MEHKKREKNTTAEFIKILNWYAKESSKLDKQFLVAKNELNRLFNAKIERLKKDALPDSEAVLN